MLRANLLAMGFSVLVPSMIFAQSIIQLEEKAYQDSVARIMPSGVRIETFGGTERIGRTLVSSGPTSGLVVSEDGIEFDIVIRNLRDLVYDRLKRQIDTVL